MDLLPIQIRFVSKKGVLFKSMGQRCPSRGVCVLQACKSVPGRFLGPGPLGKWSWWRREQPDAVRAQSIPGYEKNVTKAFLQPLYRKWGRCPAAPHMKFYGRFSSGSREFCWAAVGSHNLSKAAWGCLQKKETQVRFHVHALCWRYCCCRRPSLTTSTPSPILSALCAELRAERGGLRDRGDRSRPVPVAPKSV